MKYILAIVLVLIIATVVFIMVPETTYEAGKPDTIAKNEQQAPDAVVIDEAQTSAQDERRAAMHAEYEKLEKARRNLERKLSRLKALLWDLKLPAQESLEIKEQMQTGYGLLKNKKMLGAYFELKQLTDELGRVEFTYQNLTAIEEKIRAMKDASG